ncbi:MAG TPA: 23S rRNA (uracil(1939)-C(5))-methyltransferase RlmD [Candidatus Aveggerthella excrementigallinarum]|nr:23S rRNA (uracil(1939)-C(5))-methyltransferase RlmD [Candidatus Aveggerthella excrementigallinarum]
MGEKPKARKTSAAHEKAKATARAKRLERAKGKRGAKAAHRSRAQNAKGEKAAKASVHGEPRSARDAERTARGSARGAKAAGPQPAKPRRDRAVAEAQRAEATERKAPSRSGLSCPVERECGACQLLGVPYAEQLEEKQARMRELFGPLSDDACAFLPICGMDRPLYYRNKVMTPYAPGRVVRPDGRANDGSRDERGAGAGRGMQRAKGARGARGRRSEAPRRGILCGMYAAGSHRIIPTDECLLENQAAKRILLAIRQLMLKFRIEPYDEDALSGFLRHAVVRVGHESGEVLVTLVTNGEAFPGSKNFARELVRRCPEITTVVQNVNTRDTNAVLGHEGEHVLYGPGFILDTLCGLSFRISSHSFYQVNAVQTEVLYRRAIELARLSGGETVLDAYCGTGTIGLVAAHGVPGKGAPSAHAARVIGVDNVASAIADARENAAHNGVGNAEFAVADAGAFMRERAARGDEVDVLLMDPPRAGASEEFLEAVRALKPRRVVYVSCNPQTQARDVAILREAGYRLTAVQPVDMFPHTAHVENICVLEA